MRAFICCFAVLSLAMPSAGQQSVFEGGKTDRAPVIDGVVTPEEWAGFPGVTAGYDEQTGAPVPKEFEQQFWLSYDSKFIYIAARLKDPDPKQIRATEYRTNVSVRGDDFMIFFIDPFGTLSDANQFEINPRGAANLRIAGGRAAKREWLGEIESKGRITDEGWEMEARIPWAIMRLPSPGKRDIRAGFGRVVARTGRAFIADNISSGRINNIGIWKGVDVPQPLTPRSIKLLPYVYGGADENKGAIFNGGLDFKAPLSSALDLVGTANPDFRNIENQVLSLDFSYFERLAEESRPFFLEGQDYFSTSRDAPLFASERIRDFDFGAKTYGKLGENTTIGILNTSDFGNQNSFAGDFQYAFSERTSATVAVTDLERPGLSNLGSFIGFSHGAGAFEFFGQHMTTRDTALGTGHRYNTGFFYNQGGLQSGTEYIEISPEFMPRLGFAPERGFKGFTESAEYVKPVRLGRISELGVGVEAQLLDNYSGGGQYRKRLGANTSTTLRDGTNIKLACQFEEFGGFKDRYFFFSLDKPRGDPYRHWQIDYVTGNIADHSYQSIRPTVSYRPWQHFQVNASYQRVDHSTRQEQTILSANYDINASDAVSGRLISQDGNTNFYLAFRRAGNRGNEYYVILGDPNARSFRTSLIIKIVMPFNLRF